MRHLYAHAVACLLAGALVLFAALFAWGRSAQLVVATERDVEPPFSSVEARDPVGPDGLAFGEGVYVANCRNCHTGDGGGRGMYPPVRGLAVHLDAPGGRGYLLDVALHGLYTGEYGAPMPPMPELSDAEIAAVTNYTLVAFADGAAPGPERLFRPGDVAARRGRELGERDVAAARPPVPSAAALGAAAAEKASP